MGEAHRRVLAASELSGRLQQPQAVAVQLKILGPDFTVLAMYDMAIHFIGGIAEVLNNLGKPEVSKVFGGVLEHLQKSKMETFAKAAADGEKAAPKVEVATAQEQAAVQKPLVTP